ncbi:MAG: GGDEF domain-containing protein [Actinomycetales bacterium]|nr:GGDEF domain-containing protein [Actinomycetales bacterium]
MSREIPSSVKVLCLTVLLGILAVGGTLIDAAPEPGAVVVPWWVFGAMFAVTEAFVLHLNVRGQTESVSLAEIPLVMGLFLAFPEELLAGRVTGGVLVFLLYHRQTLLKVAFNTALVGASTTAALVVFHLLAADGASLGPRSWIAALLATAAAGLLDGVMLTLVVSWYDTPRPTREIAGELVQASLVPVLVGIGGMVTVLALDRGAAALPLAVTGAAGIVGYRAFAALANRHASLERLYELSDALAVAPGSADVLTSVLTQSADLLRAEYTEVVLAGTEPGHAVCWSRHGGGRIEGPRDVEAPATWSFATSGVQIVLGSTATERAFLTDRGVGQALLVPLRVDAEVSGHLLVADRHGEERGFAVSDGRLLETVANHASIALRNSRLIDRLHFEARHDELTGLPNRLDFRDALDAAAKAAASGDAPVAVMLLDFDGFKAINDTLGHQAGDELLRIIAERLQRVSASDASVARLGGDEFAVVSTTCTDEESAMALAGRLLSVFAEPVAVSGTRLRLGGSLGISLGPQHGTTGSDLMRNADIAMYAAKAGAGGARLFSQDMVEVTATALTLATDLRDAVERSEVGIAVQPIVDLSDGRVHSVEVLARWTHPDLGAVSPEAFFAAAERSGQIVALSALILDQALELCREWHSSTNPLRVAVNLAPRWLADISLPEQIGLALARHSVPADLLCLEITETSVIADPRRAITALRRLRDMGVHLSVDDFGTGYSSLTYLSRLPVVQMKIDKSFVTRMHESRRDRAIVHSIVDLGRNLGLEVVAEGVLDPGSRRALQEMGCPLGQGYLFSQPMKPRELPAFIASRGSIDRRPGQPGTPIARAALTGEVTPELLDRPPAPREGDVMPTGLRRPPRVLP